MTPILENAVLNTHLDCQNYDLKNIGLLDPVPGSLVAIDDPRLAGRRVPATGSVNNDSVNVAANISQSKLEFNLNIPSDWIIGSIPGGDGIPRAADGHLVEFASRKGAANGYAGLDSLGKVTASHFSAGAAVGTITSIGMSTRPPLTVNPAQITTIGTFTLGWVNPTTHAWFGSDGTLDFQHHEFIYPFFVTDPFQAGMFSLPCSKFTAGVIARAQLPVARAMGAPVPRTGMVPDPGASGAHNMYLGRDMLWHHFVVNDPALSYQPGVPDVTIVLDWWEPHTPTIHDASLVKAHVTIRSLLKDAHLFYRVTAPDDTPDDFAEVNYDKTPDDPHITLEVNEHDFIEAYAAKQGYNDSDIEEWEVITPITDLNLT